MDISDIGCSMVNLSIVLGSKGGVFFTQEAMIFIDALVCYEDNGCMVAKIDTLFPHLGLFVFSGYNYAWECANYVRESVQNFSKSSKK
jgi:hypothetical protein